MKPKHFDRKFKVGKIFKWIIGIFALFFFIGFGIFSYFAWRIDNMFEKSGKAKGYMQTLTYNWFFYSGEYQNESCCTAWLDEYVEGDEYVRDFIDEAILNIIPPDNVRHYGFLVAKDMKKKVDKDEETVPLLICKTKVESVRKEDDEPPGGGHLVLLNDHRRSWISQWDYEKLDQSLYMDLETLLEKYNEIKGNS